MTVIDDFETEFKKFTDAKYAVACCNGTAALHTALLALGISKGDKVVTTPFSFISSSNCILYCGATPVFADIKPETYCIDSREVEKKIKADPNVKAIICVHLFGNVCNLDALTKICRKYKVDLVEDCAQALGATYRERLRWKTDYGKALGANYREKHVGNYGKFGTFSFYATKNLWTFEGGMLITNSRTLAKTARMIINHGQSSKYSHDILGYNYRMPQICALIGVTNLKLHKNAILTELGTAGIKQGHYPKVIYEQPSYKKLGIKGDCPNAEKAAKEARKHFKVIA